MIPNKHLRQTWANKFVKMGNICYFCLSNFKNGKMFALAQYILSIEHLEVMSKQLYRRKIYPLRDENGVLKCRMGNTAIVFEVMCEGVKSALRVYIRPHRNLKALYGDNYFPKELLVSATTSKYSLADVVLCEWYDGVTLQKKIEQFCNKPDKMYSLSCLFEEFAIELLNKEWAHGDVKPENIILDKRGLHLIDFDAMWRPGFTTNDCEEIGTTLFQHPKRNKSCFNKHIDDYPIALIVTALSALSRDRKLTKLLTHSDALLITPKLAVMGQDKVLDRIERLFAEAGDARHYRIARLLRSQHYALPRLKDLLEAKPRGAASDEGLSAESSGDGWGYALRGEFVIPPYYDIAFDFSEGLGLVRIADVWHFINCKGEVVITCGRGEGIKPFRDGITTIRRKDGSVDIIERPL